MSPTIRSLNNLGIMLNQTCFAASDKWSGGSGDMSSGIGSWRFNFARHEPRAASIFVGVGFGPRRPIPLSSKPVKKCVAGHFWYVRPPHRFPTGIPVPVRFAKTIGDRSPQSY